MSTQRVCSVEGCERPVKGRGWCTRHWQRWRKHGDPLAGHSRGGPIRSEVPTYRTTHVRLNRTRGPASAHACIECGWPAEQWAYDHEDAAELRAEERRGSWVGEVVYSLDLAHYQPMCRSCHKWMDQGLRLRAQAAS